MDGIQLGKKLKEARLSKKMTQSDVVGSFITRNMLSQIESGAATPSLRTLEYLANALELPIHFLVEENKLEKAELSELTLETEPEAEEIKLTPVNVYFGCKNAFINGNYTYVTERAAELDSNSLYHDEGAALLARSYLKVAEKALTGSSPKSAVPFARLAARYGDVGIYASREVRTEALLMLDELTDSLAVNS